MADFGTLFGEWIALTKAQAVAIKVYEDKIQQAREAIENYLTETLDVSQIDEIDIYGLSLASMNIVIRFDEAETDFDLRRAVADQVIALLPDVGPLLTWDAAIDEHNVTIRLE